MPASSFLLVCWASRPLEFGGSTDVPTRWPQQTTRRFASGSAPLGLGRSHRLGCRPLARATSRPAVAAVAWLVRVS